MKAIEVICECGECPTCQYNQAMYEIAEEFHSPESMIESFGLALLNRIVSAGFVALEDDDAEEHASTPFDHRWEGEDVLVLTDDGWTKYNEIFDCGKEQPHLVA